MRKKLVKTFYAEPDIQPALNRATERGIKLTWIVNQALRAWLDKEGYTRKSD